MQKLLSNKLRLLQLGVLACGVGIFWWHFFRTTSPKKHGWGIPQVAREDFELTKSTAYGKGLLTDQEIYHHRFTQLDYSAFSGAPTMTPALPAEVVKLDQPVKATSPKKIPKRPQDNRRRRSAAAFKASDDSTIASQQPIPVEVYGEQVVKPGKAIQLRTLAPMTLNHAKFPKGTFMVAIATRKGSRIALEVQTIEHQGAFIKVYLAAYDTNGLPGIYFEEDQNPSLTEDLQETAMEEVTNIIPWGKMARAASKIAQHTKRQPKLVLPDGYRLYLKTLSP